MSKYALVFGILICCFYSYGQVDFEKGYAIDNRNQKIECFIKNKGSKNTPQQFTYKLNTKDSIEVIGSIDDFKEFGIGENIKFTRREVLIDKSVSPSKKMGGDFVEDTLFLKVLIEGDASLYFYQDVALKRFFYEKGDMGILQLVYKKYLVGNKIGTNSRFRQQLNNHLKCDGLENADMLTYDKKSLASYFSAFNECVNAEYKKYEDDREKGVVNIWARLEVVSGQLRFADQLGRKVAFDRGFNFQYGLSLEYITPFNNGRWSLLLEPSVQRINAEKERISVKHISIELPFGARYYIFSNEVGGEAKLYFSAHYLVDMFPKTIINDGDFSSDRTRGNFSFGFGYVHKKIEGGIRVKMRKDLLGDYYISQLNYTGIALGISAKIY